MQRFLSYLQKVTKSFSIFFYSHSLNFHVSSSTLSRNWVVNNLKSTQTRIQLIIVTYNCSIGITTLIMTLKTSTKNLQIKKQDLFWLVKKIIKIWDWEFVKPCGEQLVYHQLENRQITVTTTYLIWFEKIIFWI